MDLKKLKTLFISTLYLSACTFGGGYVIVSLLKKKFVDELHYIDDDEIYDLIAIAQSSPGAIAVNGAIVIGYKLQGIIGVIVGVTATIIPPLVIISLISYIYQMVINNIYIASMLAGMQAGVGAVIASVVYEMGSGVVKQKNPFYLILMGAAFVLNYFLKVNVIYVILGTLVIGVIQTLIRGDR